MRVDMIGPRAAFAQAPDDPWAALGWVAATSLVTSLAGNVTWAGLKYVAVAVWGRVFGGE